MIDARLLVELSRRSIAFWYRVKDGDPSPLHHGEGHAVPLCFRLSESGVHVGPSAERMLARGEQQQAFGDYFSLVSSGAKVRIQGSEQPAEFLLFEVVDRYSETFLRDHVHESGGLAGLRKDLPIFFAFGPDLAPGERKAVLELFKRGGYDLVKGFDQAEALTQVVLDEVKSGAEMAIVGLATSGDDLYLSYWTKGTDSTPTRLTGLGQDPRLPSLVEMLFLEAIESTRMTLDRVRELPVLTEEGKSMLIRGGARMTATITLADGETTFDAAIKDVELEEKARFNTTITQVQAAVEAVLTKNGKSKQSAICLLIGDTITTPFFEGQLRDSFNRVLSLKGRLAERYREELFRIAAERAQGAGFRYGQAPVSPVQNPTKPVELPTPPTPPPPPEDPVDRRKREIAEQQARIAKEYTDEIKLGDFENENEDLAKALGHYQKAASLKPNETLPKEKVSELQRRIADIETATKGNEEKYKAAMEQADAAFKLFSFNVARKKYEEAVRLKPLEPGPKKQLALVASWTDICDAGAQKWPTTLLALLGGSIGAHRFYLNQIGGGILSMLSFWLVVPVLAVFLIDHVNVSVTSFWTNALVIVGLLRGGRYLLKGNARFLREHNRGVPRSNKGLIVMLALMAVLGGGYYYFVEKTVEPHASDFIERSWFGGGGQQEWTLWDQLPGSTATYKLKLERPEAQWSLFDPGSWSLKVKATLEPLVQGLPAFGPLTGLEHRSLMRNGRPGDLQLCTEEDRSKCVRLQTGTDGSPLIGISMPDGTVHTFAQHQPVQVNDPVMNALNWAKGMRMAGSVIRLGVFREYVCEQSCWASFSETRKGKAPPHRFLCPTSVIGGTDLSNGRANGMGTFTNRRMASKKFLFSSRTRDNEETESEHILTGLYMFSSNMMGPELKKMLDDAPAIGSDEYAQQDELPITVIVTEDSEAYVDADVPARFNGDLTKYLFDNLRFPDDARQAGISGIVVVSFGVYPDGSLHDVKVITGLGNGCDEEALRVIESMPDWIPGTKNGRPVNSLIKHLPVPFHAR